jgi:ferric-dicitrate binding protein FerR (iron transport regulator)
MDMSGLNGSPSDVELEKKLHDALLQPAMTTESLSRLQARVESAWFRHERRHPAPWRWAGLLAASVVACAFVAWWVPGRQSAELGVLDDSTADSLTVMNRGLFNMGTHRVSTLRVGQSFTATAHAVVLLKSGGLLHIKGGSVVELTAADEVRLQQGSVYVDLDPAQAPGELRVQTPYGLVRHLGTQFEVALLPASMRIRVREGLVQITGPVSAQIAVAEELQLDGSHVIDQRFLAPSDPVWAWVQTPGDQFQVDGHSALDLLHQVARETGRRLEFADEQANQLATGTVLHGSIRGLAPDVALRALLATTSLVADVQTDRITVRTTR